MPFRNCRMYVLIGSPCSEGHAKKATSGRLAFACANTACGHAAAPPSAAINSRRPMVTGNVSPSCEAVCLVNDTTDVLYKRTIRLSARHLLARQHGPGRE